MAGNVRTILAFRLPPTRRAGLEGGCWGSWELGDDVDAHAPSWVAVRGGRMEVSDERCLAVWDQTMMYLCGHDTVADVRHQTRTHAPG